MATLSIIVPVYNKEQYIDDCLQSILNQSFTDFELILVNDGSTDGSADKCRSYAEKDSRIIFINQENQGVSVARNVGVARASGTYIGYIDSDDTIEPDMYELLIENALSVDADISACRLRVLFPNKIVGPESDGKTTVFDREQGLSACLSGILDRSANNKIYRRSVVNDIKFEGQIYEDILYTCKAFLNARVSIAVNSVKYNYIVRDNSVSMSKFNEKYLQTVAVSDQMVKLVAAHAAPCLPEAQVFDIVTNISLLNLLLLGNKEKYPAQYKMVADKLNNYKSVISHSVLLGKKYKVSYWLFAISPKLYTSLMYLYGLATGAEVIKRTQSNNSH